MIVDDFIQKHVQRVAFDYSPAEVGMLIRMAWGEAERETWRAATQERRELHRAWQAAAAVTQSH